MSVNDERVRDDVPVGASFPSTSLHPSPTPDTSLPSLPLVAQSRPSHRRVGPIGVEIGRVLKLEAESFCGLFGRDVGCSPLEHAARSLCYRVFAA